ncbi:MAG: 50S ribosomal protein L30 [Deltaproteobacteria bacterium]|nr:50S ribosomal protein L30 [Deltaproteobacteria bacterium]
MKEGTKVKITQTASQCGRNKRVRNTLQALGLGRIGKSAEHTINAPIAGMIRKVNFLVTVTEV